jgi:hypothetical protein
VRRSRLALLFLAALACDGGPSAPSTGSSTSSGNLAVTVNGLPSGTDAAITVSGPEDYSQSVSATQTLTGLTPGTYTVTAQDVVATGGTIYSATPAQQDVSVTAQSISTASITYSPPSSGDLNLHIDGMYVTQSTQSYTGAVPLVQNRDGYLRVFVVANRTNVATPRVRVRFYKDLVLQSEVSISAPGLSVPTAVDESSLNYSWNVPVAGTLIQPGLSIVAEVDTDNAVAESNESDNAFPSATPLAMNVHTAPGLDVTFVPVTQSGNGRRGNVSDANKDDFLGLVRKMHPIHGYNAVVHAAYTTTTADTLEPDNGNGAWVTILREIDLLRVAESSSRYYYGIAKVSYTSGVAGVAYVSDPSIGSKGRAALGWDYLPSGSVVAAHELGHNWARNHAPCGDPASPDPDYPYTNGSTGVYGLDVATEELKPPSSSDIMGYCESKWISDYTYTAVLNYLGSSSALIMSAEGQPVQSSLLVWGQIDEGQIRLEPAFQVNTRPTLPGRSGPYTLEARASDGATVFSLSFSPNQIADLSGQQQSFVFALPMSAAEVARVSTLRVGGPGSNAVLRVAAPGVPPDVRVGRIDKEWVRLRWNARSHPMIMVRDPDTGEVLSLARGGDVQLWTSKNRLDLVLSDGVKSRVHQVFLQ